MYSWYAQMGRPPHKLHLQTPDAPPPSSPPSVQMQEARDRFPRYEVAGYFPVQEKKILYISVHIFGAASHWLSLERRSHSERLWGRVHWTAESAWAQAHSPCRCVRGSSRWPASPACGRSLPAMSWSAPLCSLLKQRRNRRGQWRGTHKDKYVLEKASQWNVCVELCGGENWYSKANTTAI